MKQVPDIKSVVVKVFIDQMLIENADDIEDDTTLSSLGADSLDCMEIIMMLEEEFEIEIKDEQLSSDKTLGEIVQMLEAQE